MVPFEKQSITVIRQSKVGVDTSYEPPLRVGFGIGDKTVDGANAVMGRTVLVPGAEPNPTHYHANNDVCWYIMSGRIRCIQARSDCSDRREIIRRFRLHPEWGAPCHFQCFSDGGGLAHLLLYRRAERGGLRQRMAAQRARRVRDSGILIG